MQVYYCDICMRRISEGDLAEGDAVKTPEGALCLACSKTVQPEPHPTPAPKKTPCSLHSGRTRRVSPSSLQAVDGRAHRCLRPRAPVKFVALGGILLGLLAVIVPYTLFGADLLASDLSVKWTAGLTEQGTSFRGVFAIPEGKGELTVKALSGGRWTVHLNGRMVCFARSMARGDVIRLGSSSDWLLGEGNQIEAMLHAASSGASPPRVSIR